MPVSTKKGKATANEPVIDVAAITQDAINKALEPLAKGVKSTVGSLWKIFVRRYIAKGVSEMVAAGIIMWLTTDKLWAHHWVWWLCIPFPVCVLLIFDAIQLLINPHYWAMNDIVERIKAERRDNSSVTIYR